MHEQRHDQHRSNQEEHQPNFDAPLPAAQRQVYSVRSATAQDVEACYALEEDLCITHGHSEEMGFFLPGTSIEQYRSFQQDPHAEFLVARQGGELSGYLIVLSPSHPHVKRLLTEYFDKITFDSPEKAGLYQGDNLCLPGKIAVTLDRRKQGVAGVLIQAFFLKHPTWGAFTTTLLEPVYNKASAELCKRLGFERLGTFDHGTREGVGPCKSQLVYLAPGSASLGHDLALRHERLRKPREDKSDDNNS